MGSSKLDRNKPAPVFNCPFESAKLGEAKCLSPHLCVIQQSQKRNVPDLVWQVSQNYQEYTSMKENGKRYIGLDVHKHYLIVLGVDERLEVVMPARRVELTHLEAWMKKNLTRQDEVVMETPAPTAGAV